MKKKVVLIWYFVRESEMRYKSVVHSHEISDTNQWKHKWAQEFQARRRQMMQERTEQYIEW